MTVNPIDKAIARRAWKDSKALKKKENPIIVKTYVFWLCQTTESLDAGYLYYLSVRTFAGRILVERESPKFKTKAGAVAFANSDALRGVIPV